MAGLLRRREGQQQQQTEKGEMTRQTQGITDPFQWLGAWDPFRMFGSSDPFRRMRELTSVDPFAEMAGNVPAMNRRYVPDMEVREKNDCYVICADLPGLSENDLNIEVTGNRLTISGKREEEERHEGERYWAYERAYGHFTRSFIVPEGSLPDQIEARLDNGVLEVRIPKVKAEEATRIPIRPGSIGQTRTPVSGVRPSGSSGSGSSGSGSTQTGTMTSTGQESSPGGAHEKAA